MGKARAGVGSARNETPGRPILTSVCAVCTYVSYIYIYIRVCAYIHNICTHAHISCLATKFQARGATPSPTSVLVILVIVCSQILRKFTFENFYIYSTCFVRRLQARGTPSRKFCLYIYIHIYTDIHIHIHDVYIYICIYSFIFLKVRSGDLSDSTHSIS